MIFGIWPEVCAGEGVWALFSDTSDPSGDSGDGSGEQFSHVWLAKMEVLHLTPTERGELQSYLRKLVTAEPVG
jgi:hypothetical protein